MSNPPSSLLGLCIPTYKRPDQLSACVSSIIRAAGPHRIPIFIADDSTDDTNTEVIRQLQARYPFIMHDRNPRNLGIDRNILRSVDLCTCRYAWMIGEDDRLVPEAIETVLPLLENAREELPFVYVNYASVDETLTLVLREQSLPLAHDTTVPAESFLPSYAWSIGFIGACIVNRTLWGTVDRTPYLDTYFAHVGMILEYMKGRVFHLTARSLVLNRCGRASIFTWTGNAFDVMYGWARMTKALEPHYGHEVCARSNRRMDQAHGTGTLLWYGYLRADRAYTLACYHTYVRPQSGIPPLRKAGAWLIALTPPAAFQAVRLILTALRKRTCRRITGY